MKSHHLLALLVGVAEGGLVVLGHHPQEGVNLFAVVARETPLEGVLLDVRRPAFTVILLPWNSSFRRRSKSTRRDPGFASPIGYAKTGPSTSKIGVRVSEITL